MSLKDQGVGPVGIDLEFQQENIPLPSNPKWWKKTVCSLKYAQRLEHIQFSVYLKSCHLYEGGISQSDDITSCFNAKVESKTQLNLNPFILSAIQTTRTLTPQRSQILIRSLEKGLQVEGENWEESLSSSPPRPQLF